jgi:hypothetical protein
VRRFSKGWHVPLQVWMHACVHQTSFGTWTVFRDLKLEDFGTWIPYFGTWNLRVLEVGETGKTKGGWVLRCVHFELSLLLQRFCFLNFRLWRSLSPSSHIATDIARVIIEFQEKLLVLSVLFYSTLFARGFRQQAGRQTSSHGNVSPSPFFVLCTFFIVIVSVLCFFWPSQSR